MGHAMRPGEAGRPSARQVRRGHWRGRRRWRDTEGIYHEVNATGTTEAATLATLAERFAEQQARIEGAYEEARAAAADGAPTLDALAEEWLDDWERERGVRPQTVGQYRATWQGSLRRTPVPLTDGRTVPLGEAPVDQVSRKVARGALRSLVRRGKDGEPLLADKKPIPLRGPQGRTVLGMLLGYAADHGHIDSNPLAGTRTARRPKPEPRAITEAEWQWLIERSRSWDRRHHATTPDLSDLLVVLRFTGVRIGEALAITWDKLNLSADPPTVLIDCTVIEAGRGSPGEPWARPRAATNASSLYTPRSLRCSNAASPDRRCAGSSCSASATRARSRRTAVP